jgi:hypothetical protein
LIEEEVKLDGTGSSVVMYSAASKKGNRLHQARVEGPPAVLGYQCYECGKYGHMKRECPDFIARKRSGDSSGTAMSARGVSEAPKFVM